MSVQVFLSRYVGNFTGLGAIAIIILSFYQDWAPILLTCLAAICLVLLAASTRHGSSKTAASRPRSRWWA